MSIVSLRPPERKLYVIFHWTILRWGLRGTFTGFPLFGHCLKKKNVGGCHSNQRQEPDDYGLKLAVLVKTVVSKINLIVEYEKSVNCYENFISVKDVYSEIFPGFSLWSGLRHLAKCLVESSQLTPPQSSLQD